MPCSAARSTAASTHLSGRPRGRRRERARQHQVAHDQVSLAARLRAVGPPRRRPGAARRRDGPWPRRSVPRRGRRSDPTSARRRRGRPSASETSTPVRASRPRPSGTVEIAPGQLAGLLEQGSGGRDVTVAEPHLDQLERGEHLDVGAGVRRPAGQPLQGRLGAARGHRARGPRSPRRCRARSRSVRISARLRHPPDTGGDPQRVEGLSGQGETHRARPFVRQPALGVVDDGRCVRRDDRVAVAPALVEGDPVDHQAPAEPPDGVGRSLRHRAARGRPVAWSMQALPVAGEPGGHRAQDAQATRLLGRSPRRRALPRPPPRRRGSRPGRRAGGTRRTAPARRRPRPRPPAGSGRGSGRCASGSRRRRGGSSRSPPAAGAPPRGSPASSQCSIAAMWSPMLSSHRAARACCSRSRSGERRSSSASSTSRTRLCTSNHPPESKPVTNRPRSSASCNRSPASDRPVSASARP